MSMLQCGTVQQRPKSASPAKEQTLEWKRRLIDGSVGYGDQTELFGATGLENIFVKSKGPEQDSLKPRNRMQSWLQQQKSDAPMPSSPPPWSSDLHDDTASDEGVSRDVLEPLGEEQEGEDDVDGPEEEEEENSFRSNPFDLRSTSEAEEEQDADDTRDEHGALMHDSHGDSVMEGGESYESNPFINYDGGDSAETNGEGRPSQGSIEYLDAKEQQAKAAIRAASGQTDASRFSQEELSPVYISKQTMQNGEINYAALDSHLVKQFNSVKISLRHPSQEQQESEQELEVSEELPHEDGPKSDPAPTAVDFSLSENLPTGTPPQADLSRNIQLQRGGYSEHDSFKQRSLSPSPDRWNRPMMPGESGFLSVAPSQPRPLPVPPTQQGRPSTPQRPITPDASKTRSSGSPLKLFGPHDTFTSNRLLRRLSQLDPEGNPLKEESGEGSIRLPHHTQRVFSATSQSSFGTGDLDTHGFNADITVTRASDSDNDEDSLGSPGSDIAVPGSKDPLKFRREMSAKVYHTLKLKRKLSKNSAARSSKNSTVEAQHNGATANLTARDASELDAYFERAEQVKNYDGSKRPPTSPFKNPTPKRRRTLHASELEEEVAMASRSYHSQIEAASNRKGRDTRPGDTQNAADASTLASRKILRPRNPTPSQRRRSQIEAEIREAAEDWAQHEPDRLEALTEQIESSMAGSEGALTLQLQAEAVANEIANFTLRIHKPSGEHVGHDTRKPSLTTQDFWNEANFVMQLIRQKANRPQSALSSVEESEAEGVSMSNSRVPPEYSLLSAPSEALRVSRPPSREGGHSGWRSGKTSQNTDARVLSHLRRFQEKDDTEFIAGSTLDMTEEESVNHNVVVVDEANNIRLTSPSPHQQADQDSDESRPVSQRSQGSSLCTQESAGMSTGKTFGSASTKKSDNVGTLAPNAVAHLIGEQVGGMTFDREKQQWIRVKSPPKRSNAGFLEPPSQLTSDDDPFQEISDLLVDERQEFRRISGRTPEPLSATADDSVSVHDQQSQNGTAQYQPSVESRNTSTETVLDTRPAADQADRQNHAASKEATAGRPVTRDSSHMQSRIHHMHSSSVPSRYTGFGSSQQQQEQPGTRATSWNSEELSRLSAMGKARQQPLAYAAAQATLALRGQRNCVAELPEQEEISDVSFPMPPSHQVHEHSNGHPRSLSPPMEVVEGEIERSEKPEDSVLHEEQAKDEPHSSTKHAQTPFKPACPPSSAYRPGPAQSSLRRQVFASRFPGEGHEHSELSFVAPLPGQRMMSLSLSVSRPLATRHQSQVAELQSSPSKPETYETFLMSDLGELTITEEDEQRPSEQALAKRLARYEASAVNDRHALVRKELVKTLTDVNSHETYWEHTKQLDIHEQAIVSLHGLDEYLPRVQDMDVSGNPLTHLEGAPVTVRKLVARSCQLSSLTSWAHLMNLQYLDVSSNQLSTFQGLAGLVHLRELRADDNQITSLEGILELDGLLKARLRRNRVRHVNFEGCQLQRLTELDLCGNEISTITHLPELRALNSLKLDANPLSAGLSLAKAVPRLKELSLRACNLRHLDVHSLPKLRKLDLDDNCLAAVEGISSLKKLDLLSMRRQSLPEGSSISIFDQPLEARTVRLSGNTIPSLNPQHTFLNLQHLEVSSTGLQDLPDDFGFRMPNLRDLNLSFNSLKDLRPLLNIQKLRRLSVCGNRLSRLRKTVAVLSKLRSLESLDLRDVPLTQGFYAPLVTGTQTSVVLQKTFPVVSEDEDEQAEAMELAQYRLPTGNVGHDKLHLARLDEETRLRRRVYELLLAHSCPGLEEVDGLPFDKMSANVRDGTWGRLVELGVVRRAGCERVGQVDGLKEGE